MRTIGVKRLVELAILSVPKPYSDDVIEGVLLAIERNEAWLNEYEGLCTDDPESPG